MDERTDEEIAAQVQQGDIQAFGVLLTRYEAKLLRYGRKFLYDSSDIEDLAQEIFLKTYTNIRSFDVSRKFSPWIYRIAHNEFVNALKKKGRDKISFFDFDVLFPHPAAKETADGALQADELRRALDSFIEKLDAKYREPLVLYYFEEMGYKEIADILQVPMATVGVRLQRAKLALKKLIKDKESHL